MPDSETAHYFNAGINAQGLEDPPWAGLPFTRLRDEGTRQLSREWFSGPGSMNDNASGP